MGNSATSRLGRFSTTSDTSPLANNKTGNNKPLREHKRHGIVTVKINSPASGRRGSDAQITHVVSPKGAILYGSLFNPSLIQRG